MFDSTFSPSPLCTPTRASILTGRAPHQLGEAANLWSGFSTEYRVLPQILGEAGYHTGYAGKGWAPGNYRASGWQQNPAGKNFADLRGFLSEKAPDQPFFFWLGNLDTAIGHWDYRAEAAAGLDPASLVVPAEFPDTPEVRASLLAYYNGVRRLDRAVAAAVAQLEEAGLLDQTVIVYTSDHGWNMPRGIANCYEAGIHVPLAIRWGRFLPAGRRIADLVSLTDLAPTFLELAGVPVPSEMSGRSFCDLLRGEPSRVSRDAVFIERERHANVRRGNLGYPIRAVRTADYLYLMNLRPDRWPAGDPEKFQSVGEYGDVDNSPVKTVILEHADEPEFKSYYQWVFAKRPAEELYDLRADPRQLTNLAKDPAWARTRLKLRARVEAWMKETGDPRVDPHFDGWDQAVYHGDVNTWDNDNFDGAHLFGK